MRFFLTAKSWQLFLLLIACTIGASVLMASLSFIGMVLGTLVFMGVWMGWLWTVATTSNNKVDPSLRKSVKYMAAGIAYAAFYLLVSPVIWPDAEGRGGVPSLMVPMHLLAMVGMFYALLFTANRLTTLERNQKVSFFDYSGPFFLLWFFPIGIWFIQPRVNKLLANDA